MWIVSNVDKAIATIWGSTVEKVVEVVELVEEIAVEETPLDLEAMTKTQLEQHGRTIGIELDRRKKKADLIEEIQAAQ